MCLKLLLLPVALLKQTLPCDVQELQEKEDRECKQRKDDREREDEEKLERLEREIHSLIKVTETLLVRLVRLANTQAIHKGQQTKQACWIPSGNYARMTYYV